MKHKSAASAQLISIDDKLTSGDREDLVSAEAATRQEDQQVSLLNVTVTKQQQRQSDIQRTISSSTFSFKFNMNCGKSEKRQTNAAAAAAVGARGNGDHDDNKQAKKNNNKTQINIGCGKQQSKTLILNDDIERNNSLGKDDEQHHASNSTARRRKRRLLIWTLFTLMGILIVSFLFVILLFFFTSLFVPNEDDLCLSQQQPFQQSSYRLFSTKTLYTTALYYLSRNNPSAVASSPIGSRSTGQDNQQQEQGSSSGTPQASPLIINQLPNINQASSDGHSPFNVPLPSNYDRRLLHLPQIFSPDDSLESLHRKLVGPQHGCSARQLHFYGRHAARLPSRHELQRLAHHLAKVQQRIDLSTPQSNNGRDQAAPLSLSSSAADKQSIVESTSSVNVEAGNKTVCHNPLLQFKQWPFFAQEKYGNLITQVGALEAAHIGQRLKLIYPELFDHSRSELMIGNTPELRTAQTLISFLKQVDNLDYQKLDICPLTQFPEPPAPNEQSKLDEILESKCYNEMLNRHQKEELSFHHRCKSIDKNLRLDVANYTGWISRSVSKKLKFSRIEDQLSHEETKALYDICKYESALNTTGSIWCSLFGEQELKFFEYLADLDDYYNSAYGNTNQALSACVATRQMLMNYMALLNNKQSTVSPKTQLYFTHSAVIQKLIAASVDLGSDSAYSTHSINEHLKAGSTPTKREWQTSLLSPFSANIAFTLYDCPITVGNSNNFIGQTSASSTGTTSTPNLMTMYVGEPGHLKVVVSLNEQPIKLDGCNDYVCDLKNLLINGRLAREKKCDLNEICKEAPQIG